MSDNKADAPMPTSGAPPRPADAGLPPDPAASADGPPPTPPPPQPANEATLDVAAIRARTGLSQEEFAARYRFSKRTLQEWEQGRKRPTGAARSLLAVIRRHPKKVAKALAKDVLEDPAPEIDTDD